MRYHTLAVCAVLGHIANTPYNPLHTRGRFSYRVDMETTKTLSKDPGKKSRSYYIQLNLSDSNPNQWAIEFVDINSPYLKARKYPRITSFKYFDSRAEVMVDNTQEEEFSITINAYNQREIIVTYSSYFGSGKLTGRYGADLSYVEIRDIGPNPNKQTATIEGIVRFVEIKAL